MLELSWDFREMRVLCKPVQAINCFASLRRSKDEEFEKFPVWIDPKLESLTPSAGPLC